MASMNALPIIVGALCLMAIAYRYYSAFIAAKVLTLDDSRSVPSDTMYDGHNYYPTNKWVLFGHHFAAISGAGPLIGPVLAAQFGFLPGLLWLVIGVCLGGAVHDFMILGASIRRKGKSLAEIARGEISPLSGVVAAVAILFIVVIALAGLGLVVVKALGESPWGTFTVGVTIPLALFMGFYMYRFRKGRIAEATIIGVIGLFIAVILGGRIAESSLASTFTFSERTITYMMAGYGFIASVLPVWMLLCPRDYLSSYMKIGTVAFLIIGVIVVAPRLNMPATTPFVAGGGPIIPGKLFTFVFITIACGAISGFHSLVSSGTTPKMINRESDARMIGYGSMLMEGLVGVVAMIAACTLDPGVYFAMNTTPAALAQASQALGQAGFVVTPEAMQALAARMGETTLVARSGGAPSLAVGMAQIFASAAGVVGGGSRTLDALWYHFAIMFEALFILTTIDTGTRVGRFMLQEIVGHVWPRFGETSWYPSVLASSAVIVAGWGYFLYQGVVDPLGGINSLWPLFGISNQLLAAVALCVGTTILVKMGRARYAWVTAAPLAWLVTVTMTAGWQKVFSADPRLGFLAHAASLAGSANPDAARLILNDRLNTFVALLFMTIVTVLIVTSLWEWWLVLSHRKTANVHEAPYVEAGYATGD